MSASSTLSTCPNCGARAKRGESACAWCGAEFPTAAPSHREPQPIATTKAARFRALVAHPDYPQWLTHRPSTRGLMRVRAGRFLSSLLVLVVIGIFTVKFLVERPVMALVPLAMGILVIVRVIQWLSRARSAASENVRALPALVLERREQNPRDTPADALRWRVLVERQDGTREELEVPEAVVAPIAPGDIGVAYVTAGYLAEFRRVDV